MQSDKNASFDGDILHPYALFMLAAENANQKWYYVSDVLSAPEAGGLLKNYQLDKGKKTQMQRLASRWKERKMFDAAKEVYSEADFKKFENALNGIEETIDDLADPWLNLLLSPDDIFAGNVQIADANIFTAPEHLTDARWLSINNSFWTFNRFIKGKRCWFILSYEKLSCSNTFMFAYILWYKNCFGICKCK